MRYKLLILILLFDFCCNIVIAQNTFCENFQLQNDVSTQVLLTENIFYKTDTTLNGNVKDLTYTIYEPFGDTISKRPFIMFIHGGGFLNGNKTDISIICERFARKGFVTASIEYRLVDVDIVDSNVINEALIMAVCDAKAALNHVLNDAFSYNNYRIDTSNVFIGGASAGAITALHLAYLDSNDNIPNNILELTEKHRLFKGANSCSLPIKGVLNYSGALWNNQWISEGEPALYSVHDELDPIVPCGYDKTEAYEFEYVYTYGSCSFSNEASEKKIKNDQYIFKGSDGHVSYFFNPDLGEFIVSRSSRFLYDIICENYLKQLEYIPYFTIYPNPVKDKLIIEAKRFVTPFDFSLYNSFGEEVFKTKILDEKFTILISDFSQGIYYYKAQNHIQKESGRLIINN